MCRAAGWAGNDAHEQVWDIMYGHTIVLALELCALRS